MKNDKTNKKPNDNKKSGFDAPVKGEVVKTSDFMKRVKK